MDTIFTNSTNGKNFYEVDWWNDEFDPRNGLNSISDIQDYTE